MHPKILVTGASGFVGRALCVEIAKNGWYIRAAMRRPAIPMDGVETVFVGNIDGGTRWDGALDGLDVVIHLAARAHVFAEDAKDPMAEFRRVNVAGTENLARAAASRGVKRLVFVSSIGVNGLFTTSTPFDEMQQVCPHNPYAISKWEAEQALFRVAEETGLEIVIVRPPLVYGAGAPGNFAQMMRAIRRGIPLPLGSVENSRSLLYLGNLVDALIICATHPAAAGQIYIVSDGEDISTPDLLRRLYEGIGRSSRLFRCPPEFLELAGAVTGKSEQVQRLVSSLQVDSGKIRRELNWKPPYSLRQALHETAMWYRGH